MPATSGFGARSKDRFLTMLVTLALAFPIGVFSGLYLEEYRPAQSLDRI